MRTPKATRWKWGWLGLLAWGLAGTLSGQEVLLRTGHNDLAVSYEPGVGWQSYLYDYADGSRREVAGAIYHLGAEARSSVPADTAYGLLGAPGATVWVAPEIYQPGVIYLGIGAPLLGRNIFTGGLSNRGQVTMRLVSVTGTGPAAGGTVTMWQSGYPPRFHFSSADGVGPEDSLNAITANFHAHYNWGFTAPGLYRLTFEYSGTLVPALGGGLVSTAVTYTFEVEHAGRESPLRYAWPLGGGWSWSSWMSYVFDQYDPWVWDFRLGWMYLPPADPESVWIWTPARDWTWTNQHFHPWLWSYRDGQWENP